MMDKIQSWEFRGQVDVFSSLSRSSSCSGAVFVVWCAVMMGKALLSGTAVAMRECAWSAPIFGGLCVPSCTVSKQNITL